MYRRTAGMSSRETGQPAASRLWPAVRLLPSLCMSALCFSVRPEGLEPPRVAPPAPKAGASANSATVASFREMYLSQVPLSSLQCLWELADESSTRRYCRSLACPWPVRPRPPRRRSSGKRQGSNLRPDPKPHPPRGKLGELQLDWWAVERHHDAHGSRRQGAAGGHDVLLVRSLAHRSQAASGQDDPADARAGAGGGQRAEHRDEERAATRDEDASADDPDGQLFSRDEHGGRSRASVSGDGRRGVG